MDRGCNRIEDAEDEGINHAAERKAAPCHLEGTKYRARGTQQELECYSELELLSVKSPRLKRSLERRRHKWEVLASGKVALVSTQHHLKYVSVRSA